MLNHLLLPQHYIHALASNQTANQIDAKIYIHARLIMRAIH